MALFLPNQCNTYDLPFCLVDILQEVKYEKNDGKNFTNQTDDISGVSVLYWIVLSWAIDKRIGQQKQENNVQWSLKTTKKGRRQKDKKTYKEKSEAKVAKIGKICARPRNFSYRRDCNILFISFFVPRGSCNSHFLLPLIHTSTSSTL